MEMEKKGIYLFNFIFVVLNVLRNTIERRKNFQKKCPACLFCFTLIYFVLSLFFCYFSLVLVILFLFTFTVFCLFYFSFTVSVLVFVYFDCFLFSCIILVLV